MARLRCDCGTRSLQAAGSKLVAFWLLTANQFLATPQKPAFLLEKVARPERFELPTFWFVVGKAGNPKALQVSHLQAAPASKLLPQLVHKLVHKSKSQPSTLWESACMQ